MEDLPSVHDSSRRLVTAVAELTVLLGPRPDIDVEPGVNDDDAEVQDFHDDARAQLALAADRVDDVLAHAQVWLHGSCSPELVLEFTIEEVDVASFEAPRLQRARRRAASLDDHVPLPSFDGPRRLIEWFDDLVESWLVDTIDRHVVDRVRETLPLPASPWSGGFLQPEGLAFEGNWALRLLSDGCLRDTPDTCQAYDYAVSNGHAELNLLGRAGIEDDLAMLIPDLVSLMNDFLDELAQDHPVLRPILDV